MSFMNAIIAHGDTIIIAIVAIILGWDRFKSGSSNLRKEIASDYKERNIQLNDRIKEVETHFHDVTKEVAELRGQLKEKDKHIESLTSLIQGRNPEMLAILTEIKGFMGEIQGWMKSSNKELVLQTSMLESKK